MIALTFVLFMAELATKAWEWEVIYLSEVSVNGGGGWGGQKMN